MSDVDGNQLGVTAAEIYKQQYTAHGRVYEMFFKAPAFYATVIGALWYFAVQELEKDRLIATAVFVMASGVSSTCAAVSYQIRRHLSSLNDRLDAFEGAYGIAKDRTRVPKIGPLLQALLIAAAGLSLGGAYYSYRGVESAYAPCAVQAEDQPKALEQQNAPSEQVRRARQGKDGIRKSMEPPADGPMH